MQIKCAGEAKEIFSKLKLKIEEFRSLGKMKILQSVEFDDANFLIKAKGVGFEAFIYCKSGLIDVDLKLGLLLKPMRSKIEEELLQKLNSVIQS